MVIFHSYVKLPEGTVSFDLRDAGDPHCVADVGRCESTTALPNSRDLQGEIKKIFGRRLGL
jgi:hypothetical protein